MVGAPFQRLWLLVAAIVIAVSAPALASPPAFVVVVNASQSAVALDRAFVADAFLKKRTRWPNDEVIRPVDLTEDAPPRRRFSEDVVGRSVSAVKSYWQQKIFAGVDVPPPELGSDAAVVAYVAKHSGAIGYVSSGAAVAGVRVVQVR